VKTLLAATAAFLSPLALAATVAGVEVPPPYAPCPVTDTHWGMKVEDPYRCLETTTDEAVQKYMKAQAEAAEKVLAKIPGRERMLKRIQEIDAEIPANVSDVNRDERGGLFYQKRLAADNQYKVFYRPAMDGPERVLVDPEVKAKETGKPHAIGDYANSRDGKFVSYSISAGGAEIGTLHAIDVESGKEIMPPIDRIRGGGARWLDDGSGFFYSRLAEGWEKRPRAERFMDNVVYLRRLSDPAKDVAVFGPTVHPELKLERSDFAGVSTLLDQPLGVAFVYHGVSPYRSLYVTDKADLLAGKPKWRKVFDQSEQVTSVTVHKGWAYLRTAKDSPRYKVLRMALPAADFTTAEVLVPMGAEVITAIAAAPEGLYYTRREGAAKKLFRLPHGGAPGAAGQPISLPFEGNVAISDVDPRIPGVILSLSGWTRAARHYFLGGSDTAPKPLALVPTGKYDALPGVTAREVKVKSHDGVEVPVSIISRTDVKLDGKNPTQLYGYAAYGLVEEPALNPRNLAWLEQGGVLVMCHARGGGINGDEWHKAGHKTTKANTWKDGIATAEWLIANGYTTKERLSIYGGSAGGIFVGRAVTERPDLFASASIGVGNTDQVRSETRANGAGNIPEYGTVKIESEFKALLNNSTYATIRDRAAYPALIFEHGVNDSRVDVWMTLKTATRFAAASSSGKPVLMRLEYDAGHGVGATRLQSQARAADRWTFFLWQAGVPEFQPRP
jgi:prolyl oligopeptidase